MKKTLSRLLPLCLCLSLSFAAYGCGNDISSDNHSNDITDEVNDIINDTTDSEAAVDTTAAPETAQWRKFLADYEAWVDSYITVVQKYKANPTDFTILAEYTEMAIELAKWSEEADEMAASLNNASVQELAEYSAELSRIALKLAQAAN